MKLFITGDIHIGKYGLGKLNPETGLNTHFEHIISCFDYLIDSAISNKCDAFVIAGDLFKTRTPDNIERSALSNRFHRLKEAEIKVWFILGNHDSVRGQTKSHVLGVIEELKFEGIEIYKDFTEITVDDIRYVMVPWMWDHNYPEIKKSDKYTIAFGHLPVTGAVMGSEQSYVITKNEGINTKYFKNVDITFLGHFHKRQVLGEKKNIYYVGSIDRIDFSEKDDSKGGWIFDTDRKMSEFIETKARKLIEVNTDFDNYEKAVKDLKGVEDAIIKISINVNDINKNQIDYNSIYEILEKKKIHSLLRVRTNIIKEGVELMDVIDEDSNIEKVVENYIVAKYVNIDEDIKSQALVKALELVKENL